MPLPAPFLNEAGLQQLFTAAEERGGEARAVGGCVRDYLLGIKGGDVDVACSLPPEQVMHIAESKGWKAVPTGLAHGTVTLVLPERTVEVTTLRRDVKTDGRHAEIAYTDNFQEDAARRDFTMNALYMDFRGVISDFFGGEEDLRARRVRFIGNAGDRIREDGLRILRFFRFLATHGQPPADEMALRACASQHKMLDKLSGERIQQEMKKLLAATDPSYALAQMSMMAMGETLAGAPWQVPQLSKLLQLEVQQKVPGHAWVRLLSMVPAEQRMRVAAFICTGWRLSRADTQWLEFLTAPEPMATQSQVKEALRHYKREWVEQALLLQAVDDEDLPLSNMLAVARMFEPQPFPVNARDLMVYGFKEGPELGAKLRELEKHWAESDYRLKKGDLLGLL